MRWYIVKYSVCVYIVLVLLHCFVYKLLTYTCESFGIHVKHLVLIAVIYKERFNWKNVGSWNSANKINTQLKYLFMWTFWADKMFVVLFGNFYDSHASIILRRQEGDSSLSITVKEYTCVILLRATKSNQIFDLLHVTWIKHAH